MELLKMKKGKSYYEGQLLMFDGIRDGENVYTFLSNVVLVRTSNRFYSNVKTEERYFVDSKNIEEGEIVCKITKPLIHFKNMAAINRYILYADNFFKDRIAIYDALPLFVKEKLNIMDKIARDRQDLQTYNRIIEEQGPIVKAYAKTKFRV